MQKVPILQLPKPSTAIVGDPVLYTDGADLVLSMTFDDDGRTQVTLLRFTKQRAFRKRAEIYCTAWHVTGSFDTVCEVKESDWVRQLRSDAIPEWRDRWIMRHYVIYVDSLGCLEVVAESASLDDKDKNSAGT